MLHQRLDREVGLIWLGHATFLLETPGGKRVLIDPWLQGNPACPDSWKSPGPVDLILVTHGHFDHAAEVPETAHSTRAKAVVCNFETSVWFEKKGVEGLVGMNKGGTVELEGLKVTMVSADHSCGITDDDGSIVYGGEAAGYVIECENGYRIYHAGDTNVFGDMAIIGELYSPDVALLPIGDFYTMGPREAAKAVELLGTKHVVPMHFGTFEALKGTPEALRHELGVRDVDGVEVIALEPGDTLR